jgi:hypothetical protein
MALQGSGTISLSQVQTEFTGANPISMSEYYKNGPYVPSTVGGAAGAWSAYASNSSNTFQVGSFGPYTYITYLGVLVGSVSGSVSSFSSGGYDYERGTQWNVTGGTKNDPETNNYYAIRRRTTATSVTVNASIPTSGTISMSQFYGGRKT